MSKKGNIIVIYICSLLTIVGSFLIIGRDAIFGDALLTEIDFTFFYVILVPTIFSSTAINMYINQQSKNKKK